MPTFRDATDAAFGILGIDASVTRHVETQIIVEEEVADLTATPDLTATLEMLDETAIEEAPTTPADPVRQRRGWVEVVHGGVGLEELAAAGWTVGEELASIEVDPDVPFVPDDGSDVALSPLARLVVELADLPDEALVGLSTDLRARLRDEAAALRGRR